MKIKALLLLLTTLFSLFAIDLPVQYKEYDNGLKLLVVPDTNVAIVSCRLYYFMGSMYEGPGTSGLSHLYEHMMFKGTKRIGTKDYQKEIPFMKSIDSLDNMVVDLKKEGLLESSDTIAALRKEIFALLDGQREFIVKDELWHLYQKNGGTGLNAWTSDDVTAYTVTLPANKVELFANIEADRMQNLVLREFYSERDVVTEERKMRYENKPLNNYYQRLESLFYTANPYRIPTIGWASDIRNYTRDKLREHINQYYRPSNAVIVLAGNISINKADSLVEKYFGHLNNPKKSIPSMVTREPAPLGEVRFKVYADAQPRIDIMYHTPGFGDKDLYALDVVESMLSGKSGRLYKRLVEEEKLCLAAGAGSAWKINDGYFHLYATLKAGTDPKKVEAIILEEIEKLASEEPKEEELQKVLNGIQYYFVSQLQNLEKVSDQLIFFEKLGDWKNIYKYEDWIGSVDKTSDVVKKYLNPKYRTVGTLLKREGDK